MQLLLVCLAAVATLVLVLVLTLDRRSRHHESNSSRLLTEASSGDFDGAPLPANTPAPDFTLSDRHGRQVALHDYQGRVVILAFPSATKTGSSPLIAQQIRGALDDLDAPATAGRQKTDLHRPTQGVAAIAVSASPGGDTPARIRYFLTKASLAGRLAYLTGTPAQLRPIWRAYRVTPASAGRSAFDRSATVLLIDRHGRERVVFGVEQLTPEALAHDVRALETAG